jgi:hypothetical protein
MTVLVVVETVLLALALLFVVALLRSHAEILRRLHRLEDLAGDGAPARAAAHEAGSPGPEAVSRSPRLPMADLVGQTPTGDAIKVALSGGAPRTLLAFLSTGCASCGPLWEELRHRNPAGADTRLVLVARGPERESPSRLATLAVPGHELVMSSAAWDAFAIPATPHFVLVDGERGLILGRGSAGSWDQIMQLLADAEADLAHEARSTSERAGRAEDVLAAAGIAAGHPSLYPSGGVEGMRASERGRG